MVILLISLDDNSVQKSGQASLEVKVTHFLIYVHSSKYKFSLQIATQFFSTLVLRS